jgi:hypothetical protein
MVICKLWLSIIAISAVNLSSILFSIRYKQRQQLDPLQRSLSQQQKAKNSSDLSLFNLDAEFPVNDPKNQLEVVRKRNVIRVAIMQNKAYWVHDNIFYEADVVDGYINNEDARPINAHSLSQKEFNTLLNILDSISN